MNKQLRDAWLAALRSGEYLQTKGDLVAEEYGGQRFCCLGVLCVVAGIDESVISGEVNLDQADELAELRDKCGLGMDRDKGTEAQTTLIEMNDEEGRSFPEIADWIEQNVPADAS